MEDKPPMHVGCTATLPSCPKPMVEDHPGTDSQPAMRRDRKADSTIVWGWLHSWGKNHPCNHRDSYHERATWNRYQKQHFSDGLSAALRRPTATALGADSELLFLIDSSATTHPGPNPASPHSRGWLAARSPCPGDAHRAMEDAPRPAVLLALL